MKKYFNQIADKQYKYSDQFVPDWKQMDVNQPVLEDNAKVIPEASSGTHYFRYETDIEEIKNGLRSSLIDAFEQAFNFLANYYGKRISDSDAQKYAEWYYEKTRRISCVYGYEYRAFSTLQVFIKINSDLIESKRDKQNYRKEADVEVTFDSWHETRDLLLNISDNLFSKSSFYSSNNYDVKDEEKISFDRESRYISEFENDFSNYLRENDVEEDRQYKFGILTGSKYIASYIEDEDGVLPQGHNNINSKIGIPSRITFESIANTEKVYNSLSNTGSLTTEQTKDAFSFLTIERQKNAPSEDENLLEEAKLNGVSILNSLKSNNSFCEKVKKYGKTGDASPLRSEDSVLREELLAQQTDIQSKIERKFSNKSNFVGNELFSTESLKSFDFSPLEGIEPLYEDVLNKLSVDRLFEEIMRCLRVDIPEIPSIGNIECQPKFDTLTIPFPPNIPTPDIFGFLSTAIQKAILTVISKVLSMLLARIFKEIRLCKEEEMKDVVPPVPEDENIPPINVSDKGFSAEKFRKLLDDLTVALSFNAICNLFRGSASKDTLKIVEKIIEKKYPNIHAAMGTRAKIETCFEELGQDAVDLLDKFCRSNFGVDVDKVDEYLCPRNGVRRSVKEEILSDRNLKENQIEDVLECERERDRKKKQMLKNMRDSDSPMSDMIFGDQDPQSFMLNSQPSAGDNSPKTRMAVDQVRALLDSTNKSFDGVIRELVPPKEFGVVKVDKLGNPFPIIEDITVKFNEDSIILQGDTLNMSFKQDGNSINFVEDGQKITSRKSNINKFAQTSDVFLKGADNSIDFTLSKNVKNFVKKRIVPIANKEIFGDFLELVRLTYTNQEELRESIKEFEKDELFEQSAPNNKSLIDFSKDRFKELDEKYDRSKDAAADLIREVSALLRLRFKLMKFTMLTHPFSDIQSVENESAFSKSERIERFFENKSEFKKELKGIDYTDEERIFEDYVDTLKDGFDPILKRGREDLSKLMFGELDDVLIPPDHNQKQYKKDWREGVNDALTESLLDFSKNKNPSGFAFVPESTIRYRVKNQGVAVQPYPRYDNKKGIELQSVMQDLVDIKSNNNEFTSIQAGMRLNFVVKETGGIGSFFGDAPSQFKNTFIRKVGRNGNIKAIVFPVWSEYKNIPENNWFLNKVSPFSLPKYNTYERELKEEVVKKLKNKLPVNFALSLLRIFAFEKAKEVFEKFQMLDKAEQTIEDFQKQTKRAEENDILP